MRKREERTPSFLLMHSNLALFPGMEEEGEEDVWSGRRRSSSGKEARGVLTDGGRVTPKTRKRRLHFAAGRVRWAKKECSQASFCSFVRYFVVAGVSGISLLCGRDLGEEKEEERRLNREQVYRRDSLARPLLLPPPSRRKGGRRDANQFTACQE